MAFATNDSGTSLGVGFGANSTTLAFAITSDMQIAWHVRQEFLWKSGAQGIRQQETCLTFATAAVEDKEDKKKPVDACCLAPLTSRGCCGSSRERCTPVVVEWQDITWLLRS